MKRKKSEYDDIFGKGPVIFMKGKPPIVENRHWRVTRPNLYKAPGCPGHTDKSARQGYYVDARDAEHAKEVARQKYGPNAKGLDQRTNPITADEPLDVQEWS